MTTQIALIRTDTSKEHEIAVNNRLEELEKEGNKITYLSTRCLEESDTYFTQIIYIKYGKVKTQKTESFGSSPARY